MMPGHRHRRELAISLCRVTTSHAETTRTLYPLERHGDDPNPRQPQRQRTQAKRERIVECAMRHFAEQGYHGAKVEDIARELGIAKGSIFQHFKSKAGLFFEAYKRAATSLPAWLDAPDDVKARGVLRRGDVLARADRAPDQGGLGPNRVDPDRRTTAPTWS